MARTDCYHDRELDAEYPLRWPAVGSIVLKDGRELTHHVEFATGEPENPVSLEALRQKFESLSERADAKALADAILSVDRAPDLGVLSDALSA